MLISFCLKTFSSLISSFRGVSGSNFSAFPCAFFSACSKICRSSPSIEWSSIQTNDSEEKKNNKWILLPNLRNSMDLSYFLRFCTLNRANLWTPQHHASNLRAELAFHINEHVLYTVLRDAVKTVHSAQRNDPFRWGEKIFLSIHTSLEQERLNVCHLLSNR